MVNSKPLSLCLLSLILVFSPVMGGQPCSPFEERHVDPALLELMRSAANEQRLYRVVPQRSRVGFCVRHFPGQEFRGEFTGLVGGLVFPPRPGRDGQALLLVHTATLTSESDLMLPLVRGGDFMDVEQFPEILFVGHSAHWQGPAQGHVHGELTLRGVTQPVTFEIEVRRLNGQPGERPARIHLEGSSQVQRSHFDMHGYRLFVSSTVRLCLDAELVPWE